MEQASSRAGCPVTGATGVLGPTGCPVSARAAAFNPFEDDYHQDPGAYVAWAREEEPVFYAPEIGYWVVTRYEDVKAVFRDNHTFSPAVALEKITPNSPEADAVLESYDYAMRRTLVNEDEPEHMARRRVLMEPFTPAALAHHEPMVRRLAREYVDRFIDSGKVDLVAAMLYEVPLTVAFHFLGVPEEDMDTLREYSTAHTVNTWGRPAPEQQVAVAHAVGNFWQHSRRVLDKLRQDPSGHGWMPYSIRQQAEHPDVVTDSYLESIMMAGTVAAHETTALASANALRALLSNRAVWDSLVADPTLIPNAVEECLRMSGSVAAWRRILTADATVGDVDLPKGTRLLLVQASANRDVRHFDDPDALDVRRENASDHLTFGYGAHQCMGKNLARMELQIFLEEFTKRLPHMELVPDQVFTYLPNTSFRGPEHLWVQWDPARNPERSDPGILDEVIPVRIGEPSKQTISRPARVQSVDTVADTVVRVRLAETGGVPLPRWTPGSHIDLECGDTGLSRQYSLCSDPADSGVLEFAVLRDPESRGGSAWVHEHLRAGDLVRIRGPRNHFRLDPAHRQAVFVAGGIGITPVMALARQAKEAGVDYRIHYLGRTRSHLAYLDELAEAHGERLHLHLTDEGTRAVLADVLGEPRADTGVYACGPPRMLEELEALTADWPDDALRVEHFESTLGALDPSKEHAFTLELAETGITVPVRADQTVLAALRGANIDVQSDCEEGICGSCEVPVVGGEVDHRDLVLTRAEREEGRRMMACCSRACGDRLVLGL